MLKIRRYQKEVLGDYMRRNFEEKMLDHLECHFPDKCQTLGERSLRSLIRTGIDRATSYDITTQLDIGRFIILMMIFGTDYDTNPELPWAARILNDQRLQGPKTKMDSLYAEAATRLKHNS